MRQRLVSIEGLRSADTILQEIQRVVLSGEQIIELCMTHDPNSTQYSAIVIFGLPDNEADSWLAIPKHEHGTCSICGMESQFWKKCNRCGSDFVE